MRSLLLRACLTLCLSLAALAARATSDPLIDLIAAPGGAGLGAAARIEASPYRGGGTRTDLVPLYMYEGKHLYLHAYRFGLKLLDTPRQRVDVFLAHRFEGFPYNGVPASLAGMTARQPEMDFGLGYERRGSWGALWAEWVRDATNTSGGSDLRLGYNYSWRSGRLVLHPHFMLSLRDARLNDYYYGVRADEATPTRPAYMPGSGVNAQVGLYASYDLTERSRLLMGATFTRWAQGVRHSPIVDDRVQVSGLVGWMYDFSPREKSLAARQPLVLKVEYGRSTDCNLVNIMRLGCTSTHTVDNTRIAGIEIGRPFIQGLNGWPLDFVGYLGLVRHQENGLQANAWQLDAYVKGYYYGFPWSDRVRTRLGFGVGLSYAERVPYVEARDQAQRGRGTSRLLNYLDPSIDVSVGDLFGVRSLRKTYFGFGVSHRSGIFGDSQLLGNVNGGSNYIYSYLETSY